MVFCVSKDNTAYERRIRYWSSAGALPIARPAQQGLRQAEHEQQQGAEQREEAEAQDQARDHDVGPQRRPALTACPVACALDSAREEDGRQMGRASWRERACPYA